MKRGRLRAELLHGPNHPPDVERGDRTICLFRDCEAIVTSWSAARISWPRCRPAWAKGGGSGLLVTDELVRAIKSESSLALQHWFGINPETVWRWRKAFGVTRIGTDGSRRLHQVISEAGGAKVRGKKRPRDQVRRQAATRRERHYPPPPHPRAWKPEQLALLGTMPDEELASLIGETANGVRLKRERLGIRRVRKRFGG
jgi:hypothetical protein